MHHAESAEYPCLAPKGPKKALNPVHLIQPLNSAIQNSFIFYYTIALFAFCFIKVTNISDRGALEMSPLILSTLFGGIISWLVYQSIQAHALYKVCWTLLMKLNRDNTDKTDISLLIVRSEFRCPAWLWSGSETSKLVAAGDRSSDPNLDSRL
jgi:hypothetical protein